MSNPFDYIKSITHKKQNLMRNSENDELAEKGYNPWVTNMQLSTFPDTLHYANMMNEYSHLDNRPQYEFLLNGIRSRERFNKYPKPVPEEKLEVISKSYNVNITRAREYMSLLTDEQIDELRKTLYKGG